MEGNPEEKKVAWRKYFESLLIGKQEGLDEDVGGGQRLWMHMNCWGMRKKCMCTQECKRKKAART